MASEGSDMSLPISVFVSPCTEERRIGRTLASVSRVADEIMVADAGSSTRTVEIAREASVHFHTWPGYELPKRFAADRCRKGWFPDLDADEALSPEIPDEIRALFDGGARAPAALLLPILEIYPGEASPRHFAYPYRLARLYHRRAGGYPDHPVYDWVELREGVPPVPLDAPILHYTVFDWFQMVEKADRFSSHGLAQLANGKRRRLNLRLLFELPPELLQSYILRGGWEGFVIALHNAFMCKLRNANATALREPDHRSRPEHGRSERRDPDGSTNGATK